MKRRAFIRRSSIGLGALVVGAGGAGRIFEADRDRRRIYGIPDSVRPRSQMELDLARYSLSRTDIPPEIWEDVLALGVLADDVFDRPEVAQAFTRNPRGYLKRVGLDYVSLDPGAIEVRIALALGDPDVRAAVQARDPGAFLRAIEARGLLKSPEPSQIAAKLSDQVDEMRAALGAAVSPESCSTVIICLAAVWVWVVVIQDAVAAVAAAVVVSVYAYAVAYTGGVGQKKRAPLPLAETPPFQLASVLGGVEFGDDVTRAFIDENVERIATAVSDLQIYREQKPLSDDRLRDLVRAQMLRQLSGHTLVMDEPKP